MRKIGIDFSLFVKLEGSKEKGFMKEFPITVITVTEVKEDIIKVNHFLIKLHKEAN
jgi:hypothetical protein